MTTLIIQFAKFPKLGRVKTRLQPLLGEQGCYQFHQNLVRHTARQIIDSPFPSVIAFDAIEQHALLAELSQEMPILLQRGADLGERMKNAIEWALEKYSKVILVGSDCPVLTCEHYQKVNDALDQSDFIFTPAEDGGYVLIACKTMQPEIFSGIDWGTGAVWQQTQKALAPGSFNTVDLLWDVDRQEDFIRLQQITPELCVL